MSTVLDILRTKGDGAKVATISPDATALDAAREMNQRRIGSVVVVGRSAEVIGIFTERDVLTRVVAAGLDPAATVVREVMTTPVLCCTRCTPLDELRQLMRSRRVRHVPVVEDEQLCGMVSLGDLNNAQAEELTRTVFSLEEYIQRG